MSLYRFGDFVLDPEDRVLRRGDAVVEVSNRYLDALILLVREPGRLVSKDRFMDEVWRGVPVTDEALTQCIRTLRRVLGDDAGRPRFIETVPKHGYRFVAAVESGAVSAPALMPVPAAGTADPEVRSFMVLGAAGTLGAGLAGLTGGVLYGFLASSQPLQPGMGAVSVLLVVTSLSILAGLIGGAGVAFGITAARLRSRSWWGSLVGGAAGGLLVGAFAKLLGLDAFNLLIGRSPGDITGGPEGALLGAAVGLGIWAGERWDGGLRGRVLCGAAAGSIGGLLATALGGRLMAGSLDLLARHMPGSRLRLDQIGHALGEAAFGPLSQSLTGAMEGMLFGGFMAGAMYLAAQPPRPSDAARKSMAS